MRISTRLGLTAVLAMLLFGADALATPIRPDIRKLVEQRQQESTSQFIPARAGWDGPEMPPQARRNPALEAMSGAGLARAERVELISAATPDPRTVLGILALIVLLRLLRKQDKDKEEKRGSEERLAA
jgi:hypothetical protein